MGIDISVIIPTYNREETVARAIRSAIDQDLAPAEILVVDDGSTDNTRALVQTFGDKVRYIYQENAGVSAARNTAVAEARNDWLAFLDSDDYWLPQHLSRMASAIESTKGRACCYFSDALFSTEDGTRSYWERCGFGFSGPHRFQEDASDWALMRIQPMLIQASVIERKAFWAVGGLNRNLRTREDTLLFHKLALQYPLCAVGCCGAAVTDDASRRLTRIYDSSHVLYWASSILMYKEILSDVLFSHADHRRVIKRALSDAHTGMAIVSVRRGEYGEAARSLVAAALATPTHFFPTFVVRVTRKTRAVRRRQVSEQRESSLVNDAT